jgi:hypothetical protein
MRRMACALLAVGALGACGSPDSGVHAPLAPMSTPGRIGANDPSSFGQLSTAATSDRPDFAACVAGVSDSRCSAASSIARFQVTGLSAVASIVVAPANLTATSNAGSVTLTWTGPASGDAIVAYIVQAGSSPGSANLANFSTGNTATIFTAGGVGAGSYYVRVLALNGASQTSAPSNEVLLTVGPGPCTTPGPPSGLTAAVSVGTVVLTWTGSSGSPTSYVVEAGSSSGLANLANSDLGSAATTYTAIGVGAGTYYVRLRAKGACGISGPSNEITLTVGSSPTTSSYDGTYAFGLNYLENGQLWSTNVTGQPVSHGQFAFSTRLTGSSIIFTLTGTITSLPGPCCAATVAATVTTASGSTTFNGTCGIPGANYPAPTCSAIGSVRGDFNTLFITRTSP